MAGREDELARRRFLLDPCILLLLAEAPAHGYELVERLKTFDFDWAGPGPVYAQLRKLAKAGLISSAWEFSAKCGPARRVYEVSDAGRASMTSITGDAVRLAATLTRFLDRANRLTK